MGDIKKKRWNRWIAVALGIGILFGWLVYALVFLNRIDQDRGTLLTPEVQQGVTEEYQEEWYTIYQHGRRTGYSHTRLQPEEGGYGIMEELFLRLNFLEEIQEVFSTVEAQLAPDFSLRSFSFRLQAGVISYRLKGEVQDDRLVLVSRMAGQERTEQLPLSAPLYLGSGIKSFMVQQRLQVGDTYRLALFDPATLSRTVVPLHVEAIETIRIRSRDFEAYRVAMEFHGVKLRTWISPYGELLKEEGFLGMTLVRTEGEDALKSLTEETAAELMREASVLVDRAIPRARDLKRLRLQIIGVVGDDWDIGGGRQHWHEGELTIVRESLTELPSVTIPFKDPEMAQYLQPSLLVQSDAPEIKREVASITGVERDALKAVTQVSSWVYRNLEKRPTLSVPNALEVWRRRAGDCNEHSVLFAALARAAGVPTRVVTGLLYADGRFFYHAWNEVNVGKWVAVDALLNQVPADPTHIRIIIGGLERQVRLVRLIGKLQIQVVDYQ
jgi:hypothetical protein